MIDAHVARHIADILRFRFPSAAADDPYDDGRWHFAYMGPDGFDIIAFDDMADAALFKMFWWDSVYWLRGPDVSEPGGKLA